MRSNLFLRIAAVLLCLTLLSTSLLCGLLARYTTEDTATDSARVAGFGTLKLTETEVESYKVIPGATIQKDPTVSMTASEVAVRVYVDIRCTGWTYDKTNNAMVFTYTVVDGEETKTLPLLTATLADGWIYLEDSTFTFYRDLAPGTPLEKCSVFKDNQIAVSSGVSYEVYYKTTVPALNITARAEQID